MAKKKEVIIDVEADEVEDIVDDMNNIEVDQEEAKKYREAQKRKKDKVLYEALDDEKRSAYDVIREMASELGIEIFIKNLRKDSPKTDEDLAARDRKAAEMEIIYRKKEYFLKNSPWYREYKDRTLSERQIIFLTFYTNNLNVTESCDRTGIRRVTHDKWKSDNEFFKGEIDAIDLRILDIAKAGLMSNIKKGKEKSIFRVLDTIGKGTALSMAVDEKETIEYKAKQFELSNLNSDDEEITLTASEYRKYLTLKNKDDEYELF